eukprot:s518_g22.t1
MIPDDNMSWASSLPRLSCSWALPVHTPGKSWWEQLRRGVLPMYPTLAHQQWAAFAALGPKVPGIKVKKEKKKKKTKRKRRKDTTSEESCLVKEDSSSTKSAPKVPTKANDNAKPISEPSQPVEEKNLSALDLLIVGDEIPPEKRLRHGWDEERPLPLSKRGIVLKDEARRSFVGFLPRTLGEDVCRSFFLKALEGAEWIQPTGPNGPIPRKTAWMVYFDCTCTYRISAPHFGLHDFAVDLCPEEPG